MPYLNIIFHNTQHGGVTINTPVARANYTTNFVGAMNVYQTNAGPGTTAGGGAGVMAGSLGAWGPSVTGGNAAGIFLCESQPYTHADFGGWLGGGGVPSAIPDFPGNAMHPGSFVNSGYVPIAALNTICAYLEAGGENMAVGAPALVPPIIPSPHWMGSANQAIRCLGTGAAPLLNGIAPWGSDRYAILFQAARRQYPPPPPPMGAPPPAGDPIIGIFVHTKNENADPGTQIVALCNAYQNAIIFGDLNLNLRHDLKFAALREAVSGTHTVLAIQNHAGANPLYHTHYKAAGAGQSCLDYALVPNAHVADVELWARRAGAAAALERNLSDHSVMMLRIQCT